MSYWPNTDSRFRAVLRFVAGGQFLTASLGNRLVYQIVLISALLSLFTSSIQLLAGYRHDRAALSTIAESVRQSTSNAFSNALWEYNFELVGALVEGVYNKEHVEFVRLTTPQGRTWEDGSFSEQLTISILPFIFEESPNSQINVGTLEIGISSAEAARRLWQQTWIVLLTNFLKAAVASICISILFEWSIGRHLKALALHVSKNDWQDNADDLNLDLKCNARKDEIGQVSKAIGVAKKRARSDFLALTDEIQRRTKVESDLRARTSELENANREQSAFTYSISHDMKSPANTIKLLVDDLRILGVAERDAQCREILDDMDITLSRMSMLIEDVLHYASAIEATPTHKLLDMNAIAREVVDDLRADISRCNGNVHLENLPHVVGDPTQLRLLLQNLISNGLKFCPPDRSPVVTVSSDPAAPQPVILVTDNGIGIPPQHSERIFEMFKRLNSQSDFQGTGLGLTLCKRIIINHRGTISIQSEIGKGSKFRVEFPRHAGWVED